MPDCVINDPVEQRSLGPAACEHRQPDQRSQKGSDDFQLPYVRCDLAVRFPFPDHAGKEGLGFLLGLSDDLSRFAIVRGQRPGRSG